MTPGRNDPCPCGSGRKFKHCCLQTWSAEDSARLRLRGAEGRVVDGTLRLAAERWDEELLVHAWNDFWNYDDVPEKPFETLEFEQMFVPWYTLVFVPDPEAEEAEPDWPDRPLAFEWLDEQDDASDLDRRYVEAASRSPLSALVIEAVAPGRTVDVRDILTGRRFHVLELQGSERLRPADIVFARVLTIDDASILFGMSPLIIPPSWHTHIIDQRDTWGGRGLMSRDELEDFEIEIRDCYFNIAAEVLDPTPPRLVNTDGDPIELTTLTYELKTDVNAAFKALLPLATLDGDEHLNDVVYDEGGAVVSASLTWIKAGNRQIKSWDNTSLGSIRLEAGRLVADVNSERRAERLKREIAKRLGSAAILQDTTVQDPADLLRERARERLSGELPDDAESDGERPQELVELEQEMLRRHWDEWLDTRVPALGNKTPRQAVKTESGRERLEALLADFDRQAEHGPAGTAGHLARLRQELGLRRS